MAELGFMLEWTFSRKVTELSENIATVLLEGERVYLAYKTIRDVAVITDKRIIIADKQGLRGKKIEIYTIPFKSINMYSTENAHGWTDYNSELELWTKAGRFKLNLAKGVDIREIDRVIAKHVL